MTPTEKVKKALAKVGITTANPTPREAAEKAFHEAEAQWLRMGPIHGPDRLKAALDAYADAELRVRRAAEEAHRRGAEGFEEMAVGWLREYMTSCSATGKFSEPRRRASLASLLAQVRAQERERCAKLAYNGVITESGHHHSSRAIAAAIRSKAGEDCNDA